MDSVPLEKYYDYTLNENGLSAHFGSRPHDYSTTVLTSRALDVPALCASAVLPLLRAGGATPAWQSPRPKDSGAFVGPPYTSPSVNQTDISSEPWASWHSRSLTRAGVDYTALVRQASSNRCCRSTAR